MDSQSGCLAQWASNQLCGYATKRKRSAIGC